jgi:murein DD-endopeptidase MepM/ murein hydrolase activator NlpD
MIFIAASCGEPETEIEDTTETEAIVTDSYGLIADSLIWNKGTVQKNQTLSDILLPYDVSFNLISKIASSSKKKFDVRKIRPDNDYAVYLKEDSTFSLRYFIYEQDKINFVVFDITDTIAIYKGQKAVTKKEKRVSGVINSSLYETLKEKNASDKLALKLGEVFAWQIDFYRIRKGDSFKVVFEEQFVDGEFIGVGSIVAAQFTHREIPFYAFYFNQNGRGEYFDEEGKSLRKTFLKAPLKFSRISSSFSNRRFHPVLKRYKPHLGTDYAAPTGTPIQSVGDGIITEAGYKRNNGNYVKIKHNSVYTTQYLHMSKIAGSMKRGKFVKQGDVIGYVGSTGLATGPHVCFRFWKNGQQVNHRKEEFPSSHPVNENQIEDYLQIMNHLKSMVDAITIETDESQIAAGI